MNIVDLNKGWVLNTVKSGAGSLAPLSGEEINLPYDLLVYCKKDFYAYGAESNGFYASKSAAFYKELPASKEKCILDIWGAGGIAEVFLNDVSIGKIANEGHNLFELTNLLVLEKNILKVSATAGSDSGRYTGLGICGGAQLYTSGSELNFEPYGVYVKTLQIDKKAIISATAEVQNSSSELKTFVIKCEILNRKGKRVVKKLRKVKLKGNAKKVFELKVKMSRHYDWSSFDPYMYGCKLSILEAVTDVTVEPKVFDTAFENFGVRTFAYTGKMFKLNNQPLRLKGAFVAKDNSMLGNASELSAELYKFSKIKELGFNAVHLSSIPTDNALKALDRLGLACVVDIFPTLCQSGFLADSHLFFENSYKNSAAMAVKALRNHPSVCVYSVASNPDEIYNRGQGHGLIGKIAAIIKENDPFRFVTVSAGEKVPSRLELDKYNIKYSKADGATIEEKALNAAREKNLFRTLTDEGFSNVDFASYDDLHTRFGSDKDRMILGVNTSSEMLYEAFEETDKNANVLGNFIYAGADFIGKGECVDGQFKAFDKGLLDKTYRPKREAVYAKTVLSKPFTASIYVQNPAVLEANPDAAIENKDLSASWNWPQSVGKPVKVRVYSNAEIVALFLDGKQISRKLTGKFNMFYADFKTNYFPGKLEAVGYYKGSEVSRVVLENGTVAKMLKLECSKKVLTVGELSFINIIVKDKEGRLVTSCEGNVKISVEGAGKLRALANGDPSNFESAGISEQSLYNGSATAVVEAQEAGKVFVKVTANGLLSAKTALRVK